MKQILFPRDLKGNAISTKYVLTYLLMYYAALHKMTQYSANCLDEIFAGSLIIVFIQTARLILQLHVIYLGKYLPNCGPRTETQHCTKSRLKSRRQLKQTFVLIKIWVVCLRN